MPPSAKSAPAGSSAGGPILVVGALVELEEINVAVRYRKRVHSDLVQHADIGFETFIRDTHTIALRPGWCFFTRAVVEWLAGPLDRGFCEAVDAPPPDHSG